MKMAKRVNASLSLFHSVFIFIGLKFEQYRITTAVRIHVFYGENITVHGIGKYSRVFALGHAAVTASTISTANTLFLFMF